MVSARRSKTSRRPKLRLRPVADIGVERHASWLELFFDLIFVLAIEQVSEEFLHHRTLIGLVGFVALFLPIWWAWVGYTFYADRFESDSDVPFRLMMLGGMLGIGAVALNATGAFHGQSAAFAVAYLIARGMLLMLYVRAHRHVHMARELTRFYLTGFSIGLGLWLASLAVQEPLRFAFWIAGFAAEVIAPLSAVRIVRRIPYDTSHIPERFGLFTTIVIGEMVLSAFSGMSATGWNVSATLAATTGFTLVAALWWIYFDFINFTAQKHWRSAGLAFVYGHLPIVLGLAIVGTGLNFYIAETVRGALSNATLWSLCGGTALYLISLLGIHLAAGQRELIGVRIGTLIGVVVIGATGTFLAPLAVVGMLLAALTLQIVLVTRALRAMAGRDTKSAAREFDDMPAERLNIHSETCTHISLIQQVTPNAQGCEECIAMGEGWVEARVCLVCGHVGCCDTSRNRHAHRHFLETGHPVMQPLEDGQTWRWCYVDNTYL